MADLVNLDEVQVHLGITTTGAPAPSATDNAMLSRMITAATPVIEKIAGPCTPQAFTEQHDGEDHEVILRRYPVLRIVSCKEYRYGSDVLDLVESTPANPVDGYQLDKETGTLTRVYTGGYVRSWWPGSRNIVVSYQAGRAAVPSNVKEATLELLAHWWRLRKAGAHKFTPPGSEGAGGFVVPAYGVPRRVSEIIAGTGADPQFG